MKTKKLWTAIGICAVGAACTTRPHSEPAAAEVAKVSSTVDHAALPLDLGSVMRRAHFRFHPQGDAFVSPQARIDANGALTIGGLELATQGNGGRPTAAKDGGVDIARDRCVTEHAAGTDGGIEQSWTFECAPASGDIVIRVATSGLAFTSSDEHGLRFGNMRYGTATWIDARGTRTTVQPAWDNGTITLRVPADVVHDSAFPATLDPLVGDAIAIDKPFVVTASSTQDHAAVAFNGANYLVVWDDLRSGSYDVFGARIDPATGLVLPTDIDGIAISTGIASQQLPSIASNGADFFVVWQDTRTGPAKIYGARVTGAGVVTDANGIALGGGPAAQSSPSVAWDGTNYFVVWEDTRNAGTDIYGVRVGPDGHTLAADADNGIAVNKAVSSQSHPRVACAGTRCLVVWTDNRGADFDIYGARVVSATGTVTDAEPSPLPIATLASSQTNPSIAYDGVHGNYLVAWDDFTPGAAPDIRGRRFVDSTGASLDATPIAIATGAQPQRTSSLAFDGTTFLATWTDAGGAATIFGALIGTDGTRITAAPEGIAIGASAVAESTSAVAGGKSGFFAAWTELSSTGPADIWGTRVDETAGTPKDSPRTVITGHQNAEMAPAVASDGSKYFVVWEDWRSSAPGDVYGARVNPDGTVPADDASGTLIAVAAPAGSSSVTRHVQPAVAFGSGTYLVAWTDRRPPPAPETGLITSVYALRVDPTTGKPVADDKTGVRVSGTPDQHVTQTAPVLAFTGGTFLAAWRDARNGPDNVYARTVKVGAAGLTFGDELRLAKGLNATTAPTVAGDGTDTFLIAWQDFRDGLQFRTYATRLDLSGKIIGGGDAGGFLVAQVDTNQIGPVAAWGGSEFFVAWEDHRAHNAGGEIYGRRIPKSGSPAGDDIPIATGVGNRHLPAIADTRDGAPGGNLQIVWEDDRNNGQVDIYGSLVSTGGLVREPQGLGIALESGDKSLPSVTARADGELLVAYSRFNAALGITRIQARIVSTGQKSGACTKDDDCASRFCTDGQCCDARCDDPCRNCGSGTCNLVTSGQDDHCNGISSCSATGQCIRANGQPCQESSQCASGVCDKDDGVCCDRNCDGECNTCKSKSSLGVCTVLIAGTAPVNCLPFACDGKNEQCPTKCEGDIQCARPNVCLGDGTCQAITAPTCIDTHTLKAPSGLVTECAPYACTGSSCVSKCKSLADCVNGAACDVDGVCRQPSLDDATGGCSCRTTTRGTTSGNVALFGFALVVMRRITSRKRSRAA